MGAGAPLSIFEPGGEARGGVVLVQEAFGVNAHIEDVGRRLAGEGWLTVAPHLFHRTGDPVLP
jgi:carboxymethylenebutenolidase